jgi:hemerythrin-like domain-containing protein
MDSIRHAVVKDHQRLLTLLETAKRGAYGDDAALQPAFTAFVRRLRAHMRIEEEMLYPVIDAFLADDRRVTASLRREHDAFRALVAEIEATLGRADRAGLAANLSELEAALRLHEAREEQLIYASVDRQLAATTVMDLAGLLAGA